MVGLGQTVNIHLLTAVLKLQVALVSWGKGAFSTRLSPADTHITICQSPLLGKSGVWSRQLYMALTSECAIPSSSSKDGNYSPIIKELH